jgi:hypothetical protein
MTFIFNSKNVSYLLIFGSSLLLSACGGSSQSKKPSATIPETVKKVVARLSYLFSIIGAIFSIKSASSGLCCLISLALKPCSSCGKTSQSFVS